MTGADVTHPADLLRRHINDEGVPVFAVVKAAVARSRRIFEAEGAEASVSATTLAYASAALQPNRTHLTEDHVHALVEAVELSCWHLANTDPDPASEDARVASLLGSSEEAAEYLYSLFGLTPTYSVWNGPEAASLTEAKQLAAASGVNRISRRIGSRVTGWWHYVEYTNPNWARLFGPGSWLPGFGIIAPPPVKHPA